MDDPRTDGYETVTIESPGAELRATFAPRAGMVCCSLRHRGVELLDQRSGVRAYAQRGATMGIPLLYPWANRLAGLRYPGAQGEVRLDPADPLLKLDQNGLPIHGALAGALPWQLITGAAAGASAGAGAGADPTVTDRSEADPAVTDRSEADAAVTNRSEADQAVTDRSEADPRETDRSEAGPRKTDDADRLHACLAWHSEELLAIFPYRHTVELLARVAGARLTIAIAVRADGGCAVPVSFGFHPYLTIAGTARADWQVELPVADRMLLDERMIPTAVGPPVEPRSFRLADGDWDDGLARLEQPVVFSVSAGERRIELQFGEGFSHAQVYAPPGEDFICFEPMTAPTNALISRDALPILGAGESFQAEFSIAAS